LSLYASHKIYIVLV